MAALAGVLAFEFHSFRAKVKNELAWSYPAHFDQAVYLTNAYQAFEECRASGVWSGLWQALWRPAPQGVLLPVEAAAWFQFAGPSRLGALSLNFAYFAAFQLALAYVIFWRTDRISISAFAVGWYISAASSYGWMGSIFDFRIDFIASCLYGIFICALVRADFGESRTWSVVAGIMGAHLVLYRFFTLLYVIGVILVLMMIAVALGRWVLLAGQALVAVIIAGLSSPWLWLNREAIWEYYAIGHNMGPARAIYRQRYGLHTILDDLMYYPRAFWQWHTGAPFWLIGGTGLLCAIVIAAQRWRLRVKQGDTRPVRRNDLFAACGVGACLGVPLACLTANGTKSVAVICILWPPLLAVALMAGRLLIGSMPRAGRAGIMESVLGMAVLVASIVGIAAQHKHFAQSQLQFRSASDHQAMLGLHDAIGDYCRHERLTAPLISTTMLCDHLWPYATSVLYYERHGCFLMPQTMLGHDIVSITENRAERLLEQSDVVIFASARVPRSFAYPFDVAMEKMRDHIHNYCDGHFTAFRHIQVFDNDVILYGRHASGMRPTAVSSAALAVK